MTVLAVSPDTVGSQAREANGKSSRNGLSSDQFMAGSNAPPSFIDEFFDVRARSVMPIVVEKEPLIEPHAGEDEGAGASQTLCGAYFGLTRLDNLLKEQLDGCVPIGLQVVLREKGTRC
jgi:hypothetical protein